MSIRSNLARVFAVIGIGAAALMGCEDEMPVVKKLREKTRERMEIKKKYGVDPCEVFGETRDKESWEKYLCPGDMPKRKKNDSDGANTPSGPPSDIDEYDDEGEVRQAGKRKGKKKGYKDVPDSKPKKRFNRSQTKPLSPTIQNCLDSRNCRIASRPQGSHRKG